ncbi:MAG: TIGR04255 family protein [Deltaproteobacteria bacterium]|nr:TIGR04255 family protein [Deltaproteobacteria bacterium]
MPEIRHLGNAPITEAVIDFRVRAQKEIRADGFAGLKDRLRGDYPVVEEQMWREAAVQFGPGRAVLSRTQDFGLRGLFFRSGDKLNVAQFRVDGFTFNRLAPYSTWEAIRPEVMRLWDLYVDAAAPEYIARLALRYINRLKLPIGIDGLGTYLTTPPRVPPGYPTQLRGFLSRLVVGRPPSSIAANIIHAIESPQADGTTVIIDIDVYQEQDIESRDARIPEDLEALRTVKNEIFFATLTENAVRLYE